MKMPETEVSDFSKKISNTLISLDVYKKARVISLYAPFRNEVDLLSLLYEGGKRFVFPKVEKETRILSFYEVRSVGDLVPGRMGILEPAKSLQKISIDKIDLFAVPGVAFSTNCERIGYGAGYYDSSLSLRSENVFSIGIAFDLQIVPGGFSNDNDVNMDIVITEKRILKSIPTL